MKGNVIQMNTLHLNSVRLNGIGKVQSVSLKGGSTEDPVFPPVEPPVEPTPTYTLSASVTNGKVSAKRNGSAVTLPFTANEGDTIVLEITPNDGYSFEGWADGNTDNPRSITMTADVVLSAECVEVVQPPVGKYIQFEDPAVEAICVANWSSDGIGLTEEDAAKVTTLNRKFTNNKTIASFEELEFFTGLTTLYGNNSWGGDFYNCSALQRIKFPRNLTTIQPLALYGCAELTTANIHEGITYIGDNAFYGCKKLKDNINLPNLTFVGNLAFTNCESLGDIENLGTISELKGNNNGGVFYRCASAKIIRIPASVTAINQLALYGCSSLEKIICEATTPPTLGNTNAFTNTNSCPIYVPDASLEAYKTAVNWSAYADRIHPLSEIEGNALGLVSDGNAYIVTDYYPNTYDNVEVEFESPSSASSALQLLLGSRESIYYKNLFVAATRSVSHSYVDRFYSNSTPPYVVTNGRNNIKLQLSSDNEGRLTKDLFMHNDKLVNTFGRSSEPTEYVMPYPLVVFGSNQMNSSAIDTRIFKGKIYFVKITDARSGEVKLHLQPRVVDGVAGMMDTISGTFYTNSNTKGTFSVE